MIDWIKKTTTNTKPNATGQYKFYLKVQPQKIDTSSTITLTAFTDRSQSALVPCNYRWLRIRNGIIQQITKFKGSSYICDPSDLGASIKVQIVSNDQQYSGKALLDFPIVRLSIDLRKQIQNTLVNGSTLINAFICYEQQQKQCQFKIFEDMIKICHVYSQTNYSFDYSIFQPKFQSCSRDPTRLQIIFNQKYQIGAKNFISQLFRRKIDSPISSSGIFSKQFRVQVRFQSRFMKDLFILTLKSFYTKRQLKNSVIIHKIEQSGFKDQTFDYMFQIQSLKTDLTKMIYLNERNQADKNRFKGQINKLQKQIEEIILTYTRIVEEKCSSPQDFHQSYSVLTTKRDEVMSKKFKNLECQNLGLNQRIRLLSDEIDEIRHNTSVVKNQQTKIFDSNAFGKKNGFGTGFEDTGFGKMLDQFSISQVRQIPDDFMNMKKKLDEVAEDKRQLEKKLDKSFQKIDDLEKQLRRQGANNNHTAINFSYSSQQLLENSRINHTTPFEDRQKIDKLQKDNSELRKINSNLKIQNKSLNNQISQSNSRIVIKNVDAGKFSLNNNKNQEQKLLKQIDFLKKQVQELKKKLQSQISTKNKITKQKLILMKKLQDVKSQLEVYKRNQDVMNRSQNISLEMNDYNEEQLRILRQHNQFLTIENQKLATACEKYMKQARENTKLRKQILNLKQKLNNKIINPENNNTVLSINL